MRSGERLRLRKWLRNRQRHIILYWIVKHISIYIKCKLTLQSMPFELECCCSGLSTSHCCVYLLHLINFTLEMRIRSNEGPKTLYLSLQSTHRYKTDHFLLWLSKTMQFYNKKNRSHCIIYAKFAIV